MNPVFELPITAVTLTEDRANVRRQASLELPAGTSRLKVPGVSPIICDKTLHGAILGAGKLLDLQVIRRPRRSSEQPNSHSQELWQRLERQKDLTASLQSEVAHWEALQARYLALGSQWCKEMALDASFVKADPQRWQADWKLIKERLLEISERGAELRASLERASRLHSDLAQQYEALTTPGSLVEAELELTLVIEQAGTVELAVEYVLANACWRPYHVAEWSQDRLTFRSLACLWQNTGEDWNDVSLSFSTERAALGTEPPELREERLVLRPKSRKTVVATREESVHQHEQRVSDVPGIDAGGASLRFASPQKASVPSDGRPQRVPLFEFEVQTREERVLMSELCREVLVRTRCQNVGPHPILAGPVDLIKSCGLVGRGYLPYTAPAETFTLGWGSHPELRCVRQDKSSAEEKSTLSGWRSKELHTEIHLSNLGPNSVSLDVLERIPVSELKTVKVEQDLARTTDRVAHDKDGFLKFQVQLPPFGRKTVSVAYLLSRKKDVEGL